MEKVLLTLFNSDWGTIINPIAEDRVEHTIYLENEQEKDLFISNELFGGKDWKTLIETKGQRFNLTSGDMRTIEFTYDLSNLSAAEKERTYQSDTAVVKTKTGEYKVFAIALENIENNNARFSGSLDKYITYPAGETFKGTAMFERAMVDRFKNGDTSKWDFENPFNKSVEPLFERFGQQIPVDTQDIVYNFENSLNMTGIKLKNLSHIINRIWVYFYFTQDFTFGDKHSMYLDTDDRSKNLTLPYRVIVAPLEPLTVILNGNEFEWSAKNLYEIAQWVEEPTNINFHISNVPPYRAVDAPLPINEESVIDGVTGALYRNIKFETITIDEGTYALATVKGSFGDENIFIDGLIEESPITKPVTESIGINELRNFRNEPKLLDENITTYILKSINSEGFTYKPYLTETQPTLVKTGLSHSPEIYKSFSLIKWGKYNVDNVNNFLAITAVDYKLPLNTDAWVEAQRSKGNQMGVQMASAATQFIPSVGANAGIGIKGSSAGVGVSFGTDNIIGGALGIAGEIARRKDLKNTPDQVRGAVPETLIDWALTKLAEKFIINQVDEPELQQASDIVYQFGHAIYKVYDINIALRNRYRFNFVKAVGVFNNINKDLSPALKQSFDSDFRIGITFWRYNFGKNWEGIKNYKYDNTEISLLGKKHRRKLGVK